MGIIVDSFGMILDAAIGWAAEPTIGGFYGDSLDGGSIVLREGDLCHEGLYYKKISIMKVRVPEELRNRGLYSRLLSSIDSLQKYGVRWHDTVENPWLNERHRRHGYVSVEDGISYFKIIGEPYKQAVPESKKGRYEKSVERIPMNFKYGGGPVLKRKK